MKTSLTCWLIVAAGLFLAVQCTSSQPREATNATADSLVYGWVTPSTDGIGKTYFGREIAQVMGFAGAAWLERGSRQEEENTKLAIAKLPLRPTSVVADIGAGTGYYTFQIAPKVPQGRVYAVEVRDESVKYLQQRVTENKVENVTVVKGSSRSPELPARAVDLAMMVDVYHELEYPHEMLQALRQALKPGGKLLLIEYRAEDPKVPIKKLHKLSVAQANQELAANGFRLLERGDFLPIQHFLVYVKVE